MPGPDQNNELSVLDGDDGSVSSYSQDILDWLYNYSISIQTPQRHYHIIFQTLLLNDHSLG